MSGSTPEAVDESDKEMARNLDNLALGRPLENVIRNASAAAARSLARDE